MFFHKGQPMHVSPDTMLELRMADDFEWAQSAPEVQHNPEHFGKLVVVYKHRVVAVGRDREALLAQAAHDVAIPGQHLVVVLVPRPGVWEIPQ
jgi:hypothetical protein